MGVLHCQLFVLPDMELVPSGLEGLLEVRSGVASCRTVMFMACHLLIIPELFLDVDSLSFWVLKCLF